ncbi:putative Ig domain-containing protein [Botrimarina sp.]|uniref:putative Ig domain-containing protein n=1 Tax=Botrimarina sp. TaxID=2795802 RepID=UPI0032EC6C0C
MNRATIDVDLDLRLDDAEATYTNQGTIDIASGRSLSISGDGFSQTADGVIRTRADSAATVGRIASTGFVNLAGQLGVVPESGYAPESGEMLQPLTYGARSGELSIVDIGLPSGLAFLPNYEANALTLTVGLPLRAAGYVDTGTSGGAVTIDQTLEVASQARNAWSELLGGEAFFDDIDLRVADLAPGLLGFATESTVWLDDDAAGLGWWIDASPEDDVEFTIENGGLVATTADAAAGVDLLTVLTHEYGHVLGLADLDPSSSPTSVMAATLMPGVRRLPTGEDAARAAGRGVLGPMGAATPLPDSRGKDFWLAFPGSIGLTGEAAELSLRITGERSTSGVVEIPGLDFSQSFTVTPGEETFVSLPLEADLSFSSGSVTQKGVHVTALDEVTVYGVSRAVETADVFLGLPTDILGTAHVVLGYKNLDVTPEVFETFPGTQLAIAASQDGTTVTITPTVTTAGFTAGMPFPITLDAGETFLLQNTAGEPSDLSGTVITSDRPVAVFGGHSAANVPGPAVGFADYLVEQLLPVDQWGTEFLTTPLATRDGGDTFRVIASEADTQVSVNGAVVANLGVGEVYETLLFTASLVTADKPVLVAQYANSAQFDETTSDPFMTLVPAIDQFLGGYNVTTNVAGIEAHYLNLVAPVGTTVTLNGEAIPADEFTAIADSGFTAATIPVEAGLHRLSSPQAFGAIVYGFGSDESYGYPAGLAVDPEVPLVASSIELTPESSVTSIADTLALAATIRDQNGDPLPGVSVEFVVSGANAERQFVVTDALGVARFAYDANAVGVDTITAKAGFFSDAATNEWVVGLLDIAIDEPSDGTEFAAGATIVVTGRATAAQGTELAAVLVSGKPVGAVDSAGNFFTEVIVQAGVNELEFVAIDDFGQRASQTLTLRGQTPQPRQLDIDLFSDLLTASFEAEYGHTSYNRATGELFAGLAVRNVGSFEVDAPLVVVIDALSTASVRALRTTGVTPEGRPYYDYSADIDGGVLSGGERTGERTLRFAVPRAERFTYSLAPYGQVNQAPRFGTTPEAEALVGMPFRYAARATDPDGDALKYELISGPVDAAFSDGVLTWTPTSEDSGTHDVVVRVTDGRGGVAEQRFTLSVKAAPPNRPPRLTSAPVVTASVGAAYRYQVRATDSDGDPLTYTLAEAPEEMQVDSSGAITWTPTGADAGLRDVTLLVEDGSGGSTRQRFTVLVGKQVGDQPPVILSSPPLFALSGQEYAYDIDAVDADGDPITYRLLSGPAGMTLDGSTGELRWTASEGVTLTFDDLAHNQNAFLGIDQLGSESLTRYEANGYVIEALSPNLLGLGAYGSASAEYSGSPALSNRTVTGVTRLTSIDNSPFTLGSIDVAEAGSSGGAAATITLIGELASGGEVRQTLTTDGNNFSPQTFDLAGFKDVLSVTWRQSSPFHQIDNLRLSNATRTTEQEFDVTIAADDGRGGIATQAYTLFTTPTRPNEDPVIITANLPTTAVVGQSYGFFLGASDPDGDPIVFSEGSAPQGLSVNPENGLVTWTPLASQLGQQSVTLMVADAFGGHDSVTFTVNVGAAEANLDPEINPNPNTDAIGDVLYEYQVIASDPNGDLLTYELVDPPEGMQIDPRRGLITWTPTDETPLDPVEDANIDILGSAEVTVRVNDGRGGEDTLTYVVLVRAVDNLPPRIDSLPPDTAVFGETYVYDAFASDLDGDELTFSLLAVNNLGADDEPLTASSFSIPEGETLAEMLAERGSLNIGSFTIPAGMTIDAQTGRLVWTPGLGDFVDAFDTGQIDPDTGEPIVEPILNLDASGDFAVKEILIKVEDGKGGFDVQQFPITVFVPNAAPVITSDAPLTAVAGLPYRYSVAAQDADGDPITFDLAAPVPNLSINQSTGVLDFTPATNQVGPVEVTVVARDDQGGQGEQTFTIEVAEEGANALPVVFSSLPRRVALGGQLIYSIEALDPNGDPLTFTLEEGPTGVVLGAPGEPANLLRWTPTPDQVGPNTIRIAISDGRGGVVQQSGEVQVVVDATNAPPSIDSQPPLAAVIDAPYAYDVAASDPEGDTLVYELAKRPVGMSIDALSGAVRWTPTAEQLGLQEVVVRVIDTLGGTATQTFTVYVNPVNSAPRIDTDPVTEAFVDRLYAYGVGAVDPEGDLLGIELVAGPEGMTLDTQTGVILWRPEASELGSHQVEVRVTDGLLDATQSFDVVVSEAPANLAPRITSTAPTAAQVGVQLVYEAMAVDPEGEDVRFELASGAPEGVAIDPTGLLLWTPAAGQEGPARVTIEAVDPQGGRGRQTFQLEVRAENRLPRLIGAPITTALAGETYVMNFPVVDDDGDVLRFAVENGPEGLSIDASGRVKWDTAVGDVGVYPVALTAGDAIGFVRLRYDLTVRGDERAPDVLVTLSKDQASVGDRVSVKVTAVDDVRVDSLTATVNGEPLVLDANGGAFIDATEIGLLEVVATAVDPVGNVSTSSALLSVTDPSIVGDPVVELLSPAYGEVITGPIDLIGAVNDPDLAFYTIEVAPLVGDGGFVEIARGTGNVDGGVLGRFDPSMLQNDEYLLRLYAVDAGGNDAEIQTAVSVAGDLKLGNYTLSFVDLTVPVSGVPIVVSRTYDTLTANEQSDFGYGWRLEIHDTDLRTSVPESGLEEDGIYNPYFFGARVYVTTPEGGREGFTFEPRLKPGFANAYLALAGAAIWEPRFVPDSGVTSTLTVENYDLFNNGGQFNGFGSSLAYNPASSAFGGKFTLTTKEGLVYEIDGDSGDADLIRDRNGNELIFEEDGIRSSSGPRIRFEKDARGRITALIDPEENRVEYAYDAAGDLVSVTDREGAVTRFVYRTDRPHYLDEVIDPFGRTGAKSVYDEDGRLSRIVDADGEEIRLEYDPEDSAVTQVDQLGNPTEIVYDARGNVVRQIDPEGLVSLYEYADPNNPTLETKITQVLADGTELVTRFEYDARGNVLKETDPNGDVTRFTYNQFGDVVTTTDANGATTSNRYDSVGNLLSATDADGVATSIAYDSSGNPTTLSIGGNETTFEYDSRGNVTRQEDAAGTVRAFEYDGNGNQLRESVTYSTGGGLSTVVTENDYDDEGRIVGTVVRQDGVVLSQSGTTHDAAGNTVATSDALGRVTRFVHDQRGLLTETILPDDTPLDDRDNLRTRTAYNAAGQVVEQTDEAGRVTRFEYDRAGRQTKVFLPDDTPGDLNDNPFTETVYDRAGRVTAEIDPLGNATHFVYDATGALSTTILPDETPGDLTDNPRVVDAYDDAGRRTTSTDPLGRTSTFAYTAGGMLTATVYADGTRSSNGFDNQRRLTSRTDQNGVTTSYEYNELGQLTAVIQSLEDRQLRTEYEYDGLGNLVIQRDALGRETRYEYDGLGRRTKTILPDGTPADLSDNFFSTADYDAVGRVTSTTDFNGQTIRLEYDALDRLVLKDLPEGTDVEFTYTATGQRETVTDARGVTRYEYDAQDRLLQRIDPDGASIAYTYDAAGNRTSVTTTVPGNAPRTTDYTFDVQNRLRTVADPEGGLTVYSYDAASQLVRTELPNGTYETRSYDDLGRILSVESFGPSGEILVGFHYTLDLAGNRLQIREESAEGWRLVDYAYDDLYRLTAEEMYEDIPSLGDPAVQFDADSEVVDRAIEYAYDDVGNRLERADSAEGVSIYAYDEMDRLLLETLTETGGGLVETEYAYDSNGNTLSKSSMRNGAAADQALYEWDVENRLIAADTDGDGLSDANYLYDPGGLRVSRVVGGTPTLYLLDTNRRYSQTLEEYTEGGVINASYVFGADLISQLRDSVKIYYHTDGSGSVRALSDIAAVLQYHYEYDAYGRISSVVGSTTDSYLFSGEYRDAEVGLDYLRARFFDPSVGRFVSADPFGGIPQNPLTLNGYAYANDNPINYADPSGYLSLAEINVVQGIKSVFSALRTFTQVKSLRTAFTSVGEFVNFIQVAQVLVVGGYLVAADLAEGKFSGAIGFKKPEGQKTGSIDALDLRWGRNTVGEDFFTLALDLAPAGPGRVSGGKFRLAVNLDTSEVKFQFGANFNLFKVAVFSEEIAKLDAIFRANVPLGTVVNLNLYNSPSLKGGLEATFLKFGRFSVPLVEVKGGGFEFLGRVSGSDLF